MHAPKPHLLSSVARLSTKLNGLRFLASTKIPVPNSGVFKRQYHASIKCPLQTLPTTKVISRNMWSWLNPVWNKYDSQRVKEVGPDQAAAEWLLRCGASVKFVGRANWDRDYNTLVDQIPSAIEGTELVKDTYDITASKGGSPAKGERVRNQEGESKAKSSSAFIESIDTNESGVDDSGFEYLRDLKHLKDISLRFSPYVTDGCLKRIAKYSAQTLEHLTIQDCYEISEWGLLNHLGALTKLKTLSLKNMPLVKDNKDVVKGKLKEILPKDCEIIL